MSTSEPSVAKGSRSWKETRSERPPREVQVAEHMGRLLAELWAYRLREVGEERD